MRQHVSPFPLSDPDMALTTPEQSPASIINAVFQSVTKMERSAYGEPDRQSEDSSCDVQGRKEEDRRAAAAEAQGDFITLVLITTTKDGTTCSQKHAFRMYTNNMQSEQCL